MGPDPANPPPGDNTPGAPPTFASLPPLTPVAGPPAPPPAPKPKPSQARQLLSLLLGIFVGLFLLDSIISLVDSFLVLALNLHVLSPLRGVFSLGVFLAALLVYLLMALTPLVPKRWFLPLTLFGPATLLLFIPPTIYFYGHSRLLDCIVSLLQFLLALFILQRIQGSLRFRWPFFAEHQLGARGFSWLNLVSFIAANIFIGIPVVLLYLALCTSLAISHFTAGFLKLRPGGLTVQVRKYARADGHTIQLVPMAHIADAGFYHALAQSFPSNSVILMEGVSDNHNLLTNRITYKQMAKSLHLSEQVREFKPEQGEMVPADVDVEIFTPATIDFLNVVIYFHNRGVTPETILELTRYSPPPDLEKWLFEDLLHQRNRHVLKEIKDRLPDRDYIVVPWGVAHMPEIATEIEKLGFLPVETRDYDVIRFGKGAKRSGKTD